MQLVSALLFSLPPPLGRNPQIGIKPNAPGGVELQMRDVSCLGGGEKGEVGRRGWGQEDWG